MRTSDVLTEKERKEFKSLLMFLGLPGDWVTFKDGNLNILKRRLIDKLNSHCHDYKSRGDFIFKIYLGSFDAIEKCASHFTSEEYFSNEALSTTKQTVTYEKQVFDLLYPKTGMEWQFYNEYLLEEVMPYYADKNNSNGLPFSFYGHELLQEGFRSLIGSELIEAFKKEVALHNSAFKIKDREIRMINKLLNNNNAEINKYKYNFRRPDSLLFIESFEQTADGKKNNLDYPIGNTRLQVIYLGRQIGEYYNYLQAFSPESQNSPIAVIKIKWKCNPRIVGFIITQLADKGYIEYPLRNGKINKTGLGIICWQHFDIKCKEASFLKSFIIPITNRFPKNSV